MRISGDPGSGATFGVLHDSIEGVNEIASPQAEAGGPYFFAEGQVGTLILDASTTDVPGGHTAVTYEWALGDGDFDAATGVTPSFTWADLVGLAINDSGTFQIAVRVTSQFGGTTFTAVATTSLTVADTPPILVLSGNPTIESGSVYTLGLTALDPGDDAIHTWLVDWNDGSVVESFTAGDNALVQHVYLGGAPRTINVTALDEDGGPYGPATLNVNVTAARNISGPGVTTEGAVYSVALNNPSAAAIATWTVSWGDGTQDEILGTLTSAPHAYTDDGSYRITAVTRDTDGSLRNDLAAVDVLVANAAPLIVGLVNDGPVDQGNAVTITVTASDPGASDQLTYEFDFDNDGTFGVSGTSASAVVPASLISDGPGSLTVRGRIEDQHGGFTDDVTTMAINNVAPTITELSSTNPDLEHKSSDESTRAKATT